jgi:hypothetical protein
MGYVELQTAHPGSIPGVASSKIKGLEGNVVVSKISRQSFVIKCRK